MTTRSGVAPDGVVVTGLGVVCPTGADVDGFAAALRAGVSGIGLRPATVDGEAPGMRPRLVADLRGFDLPGRLAGLPQLPETTRRAAARVAGRSPLAIQAGVAAAVESWLAAGLHRAELPGERVGIVVAGHNLTGALAERARAGYQASPAHLPGRFALWYLDTDHVGSISQILGITGEGYTVGGASASGNVAIINAARLVAGGELDACLVVGALTALSAMEAQAFHNLGAMAGAAGADGPQQRCRPFDTRREGFVPGEAAGCLVLESAGSAARRGAEPLARVAGYAARLAGTSLPEPDLRGEVGVMTEALRRAELIPAEVDYVNAHGTGSPLGDDVEAAALRAVFGPDRPGPWINSTKALIGHCLCAAGVVEAIAAVVQMRGGFVHANPNLDESIAPDLRLVGRRAEPAEVRVAVSNGFGFGGFNTSVVLTSTTGRGRPSAARR
ncbi:MAG: polyketide beta-ketoacyl:ACP synthase [Actinobacteria bacterium]|nr:polyketide beta-ketoacyl:ACP synthase [Actinomycetota bacterium]